MKVYKFPKDLPCQKSECKTIISLQNLLLTQAQVSLSDGYRAMAEEFHLHDKRKFRVLAVHVIRLSAKCLAEWVTIRAHRKQIAHLSQYSDSALETEAFLWIRRAK